MKAVTFYLIMFCDFKFILWINCEAELIREEKQKKNAAERGVWDNLHISCRMRRKRSIRQRKLTRLLSPRYHAAQRCG
ncbi:FIG01070401: hypothetical protein [Escherichia coli IS35]|nr:FIG01070401: hypothetical protein [Escherichia coli IS35]